MTNVLRCAIVFRETHSERSSRLSTALHVHMTYLGKIIDVTSPKRGNNIGAVREENEMLPL